MFDLMLLVVTLAFFALALAYVAACERLGKGSGGR
jgi:hypothetical protein